MNTVTLHMIDETGRNHTRTIDITNAMSSGSYCWELRDEADQYKNLNRWIKERGNEQHRANLRLISWTINRGQTMSILTKSQYKKITKEINEHSIMICTLKYDDECNNGHNTFSITYDEYMCNKTKTFKKLVGFGCDHDIIKEFFPEFYHMCKWHLTSSNEPLYYIQNTLYWISQGNLDYARSSAVWPDAKMNDFTEENLKKRLPELMENFRRDIESLGFIY